MRTCLVEEARDSTTRPRKSRDPEVIIVMFVPLIINSTSLYRDYNLVVCCEVVVVFDDDLVLCRIQSLKLNVRELKKVK